MKLYKKLSLLLSMGIMGIGLITFRFAPATEPVEVSGQISDSEPSSEPTPLPTSTPTPTPTLAPTPTPVPNNLVEIGQDSDIYKLVSAYLNAKLTCDRMVFENIVTNPDMIDEENLQAHYSTIVGFDNIKCYTKTGYGPIDYIVYYSYYMDITTVETEGISIDRSFITTAADGTYRIFTGDVDDETQAYLDEINSDADVQELIAGVYDEMEREVAEDEGLLAYWVRMYNMTEENTEEDESELIDETETDTDNPEAETGETTE